MYMLNLWADTRQTSLRRCNDGKRTQSLPAQSATIDDIAGGVACDLSPIADSPANGFTGTENPAGGVANAL
jgi:hypothetical protein